MTGLAAADVWDAHAAAASDAGSWFEWRPILTRVQLELMYEATAHLLSRADLDAYVERFFLVVDVPVLEAAVLAQIRREARPAHQARLRRVDSMLRRRDRRRARHQRRWVATAAAQGLRAAIGPNGPMVGWVECGATEQGWRV